MIGCAFGPAAPATPVQPGAIQGIVHGGQQAVVGAHVYLYAANTAGYNIGAATYGSISLLTSSVLTNDSNSSGMDTSGNYYVVTDGTGSFHISNDYSCTPDSNGVPGQQLYLYTVGGNPGSGNNAAASFMAVLGDCPAIGNFSVATPYVWMNEVSTVAAAYAMAGFAYNSIGVSSSGTNLAKVGIANAFANAANLVNLATGTPLTTTPAGNGTVPQSLIITLANMLAACVNSTGLVTGPPLTPNATPCYTLFTNAEGEGVTGLIQEPTDTATAMINIAHNPGRNVTALYDLQTGMPAFGLGLTTQPNDFTMLLQFAGGGLYRPEWLAIDGSGNVWITDPFVHSVSELSNTGAAISPSGGYTGAGNGFGEIAIDVFGNAWTADSNANGVSKLTNGGVAFPGSPYTGGGLDEAYGIAIDASGNVWIANNTYTDSVSEFTNAGVAFPNSPYTGGGLIFPTSVAIDGAENVWTTNGVMPTGSLSKLSSTGVTISPSAGYTGGGLNAPLGIAIDSSGNVWAANNNTDGISKFSNAGTALSPSTGYTGGGTALSGGVAIDGAGNVWFSNSSENNPNRGINDVSEFSNAGVALSPSTGYIGGGLGVPGAVAVDGSGNVWVTDFYPGGGLNELVGAATPVITPICAGLPATPTADGSSKLGTRP
jgi:hypothetical protein